MSEPRGHPHCACGRRGHESVMLPRASTDVGLIRPWCRLKCRGLVGVSSRVGGPS